MPNIGLALKREAVAQAWSLWISTATGETPNVDRTAEGVDITWKPGQAKKMEAYLSEAMETGEPSPDDLNVNVPLAPVILPIALKKSIGWIALYTAIIVVGTKLVWK